MPKNIQKRLIYSISIVLVWLGFVVEGSHALLSANATLTGNVLTTGTVGLQISSASTSNSANFADTAQGFAYNLNPGINQDNYIFLKNNSPASLPLDITVSPLVTTPNQNLLAATTLEFTPVDDMGTTTGTPVSNTMSSLLSNGPQNLGITVPDGAVQRVRVRALLSTNYTQKGESMNFDLDFTGTQHYAP